MLSLSDIRETLSLIRPYIHKTPLIYSDSISRMSNAEVYLKCENLQKTGSFKVRGAFSKLLSLKAEKVIAASMGNHAQGIAYAAGRLGIAAKIVMPEGASIVKEEAVRAYGAEVFTYGETLSDALGYAMAQKDYAFIHPYDDWDVIKGQGTLGIEIADDLDGADYAIAPVGGGGLIAGVAVALKSIYPSLKVIGVQSTEATSAILSFKEKKVVESPAGSTLADGIAVGRVGEKTLGIMLGYVDDMVVVSEESIAKAILLFLERKKLVVEGAGAVALAGLMERMEMFGGKRVVLIVSGGNIDFTLVDRIIHKGLIGSGRIGFIEATVRDAPGALHMLTGIVHQRKGNIVGVVHDRLSADLPIGKTRIILTVEVKNKGHLHEIVSDVRAKDIEVK